MVIIKNIEERKKKKRCFNYGSNQFVFVVIWLRFNGELKRTGDRRCCCCCCCIFFFVFPDFLRVKPIKMKLVRVTSNLISFSSSGHSSWLNFYNYFFIAMIVFFFFCYCAEYFEFRNFIIFFSRLLALNCRIFNQRDFFSTKKIINYISIAHKRVIEWESTHKSEDIEDILCFITFTLLLFISILL